MIKNLADLIVFQLMGLEPGSRLGEAAHFFIYDTTKILALLFVMTVGMGYLNSYMPVEKVRDALARRRWYGLDHLAAAVFGALTPFCSCSSIPLFIGFLRGGIPLGVTLSFLITSPLVNEVAVAVLIGLFGWKVAAIYAGSGILLGAVVGRLLGALRLERHVEDWVSGSAGAPDTPAEGRALSWIARTPGIVREALHITRGILPYLLIGIGIGALIHGYVPTGYFERWITKDQPLGVPIAVLLGVPMYANATGIIPVLQALVSKGIPLGTALAFSMAVVGLSLPEAMLLRKIMKPALITWFFASVSLSIIVLGYLFNLVL